MRNFNESTITDAVIERINDAPDARVKEISASLIRHLHDFVRDVRLTEAEWSYAIDFLTRTGKTCDGNRQEFILLSDTLGVSMLVDAINHASPGATETTVLGPFYVENPPEYPSGADIRGTLEGDPLYVHGRVTSTGGAPLANAVVDVWHSDKEAIMMYSTSSRPKVLPAERACTPTPTASTAFGRSSRQPIRSPTMARSATCLRLKRATPGDRRMCTS